MLDKREKYDFIKAEPEKIKQDRNYQSKFDY